MGDIRYCDFRIQWTLSCLHKDRGGYLRSAYANGPEKIIRRTSLRKLLVKIKDRGIRNEIRNNI